ncbi:UNVERIFIED_CONTAM: hypothetical protein HDU68_007338 [Siphonaria sp. JEL0065]|nr:hypothetical protein HDU68_007338 [Siphonaria sp. JEL0065]
MRTFASTATQTEQFAYEMNRETYDSMTAALFSANLNNLNCLNNQTPSRTHPLLNTNNNWSTDFPGLEQEYGQYNGFAGGDLNFDPLDLKLKDNNSTSFTTPWVPVPEPSRMPSPSITPELPHIPLPSSHLRAQESIQFDSYDSIASSSMGPSVYSTESPPSTLQANIKNPKKAKENKSNRFRATQHIFDRLSSFFAVNAFPTKGHIEAIAERLDMQPRQVKVWFQNRRATLRVEGHTITKQKNVKTEDYTLV